MLSLLAPLFCLSAAAADPEPYDTAVLVNPIGPVTAVVANALGIPAFDANLKLHHMPRDGVGFTVQTDLTNVVVEDLHVVHSAVRFGPRFSLRKRGLADWTLTPYAVVGYTGASAAHTHLVRYGVVGAGLDAGRTWVWKRFTMELGLGVLGTAAFAVATPTEVLADRAVPSLLPVQPHLNWSLGYAF